MQSFDPRLSTSSCPHSRQGIRKKSKQKKATDSLQQQRCSTQQPFLWCSIECVVSELCKKCKNEVGHTSLESRPKQNGNTPVRCRGVVDKAFADPVVRKRMTGEYMQNVFGGSGFVAKATNHFGLRGFVLDTKCAPKYDVTKPLVLTRIREDVSAGKCVATMISPPRQEIISANAAIAYLLHCSRMLWILEHPCDSWLWDVPTNRSSSGAASHGLGLADYSWYVAKEANDASCWQCGKQRFAPYCSQMF